MSDCKKNHLRGKGASTGLDYRCFEHDKLLNMFEDDKPSTSSKEGRSNPQPKAPRALE